MMETYWSLMKEIRKRPDAVLSTKVRLAFPRKLYIAFSTLMGRGLNRV